MLNGSLAGDRPLHISLKAVLIDDCRMGIERFQKAFHFLFYNSRVYRSRAKPAVLGRLLQMQDYAQSLFSQQLACNSTRMAVAALESGGNKTCKGVANLEGNFISKVNGLGPVVHTVIFDFNQPTDLFVGKHQVHRFGSAKGTVELLAVMFPVVIFASSSPLWKTERQQPFLKHSHLIPPMP